MQAHNHNDRDAQHRSGDDDGRWPQAFYRKERDRIMRNISRAHGREEDEPQDHWCKHVPSVDALSFPPSAHDKITQGVERARVEVETMEITDAVVRISLPPPFRIVSPDKCVSTDDEHPRQHEEFGETYPCFNSAAAAALRRVGQPRHSETRTRWARGCGSRLACFHFLGVVASPSLLLSEQACRVILALLLIDIAAGRVSIIRAQWTSTAIADGEAVVGIES